MVMEVFPDGRAWRNPQGQLHRVGGPALEVSDGTKEWWAYGELHREDGPAVEAANGDKEWWRWGRPRHMSTRRIPWLARLQDLTEAQR